MIVELAQYIEAKNVEQMTWQAERDAELTQRANLEWVLLDLLADIQAG